LPGELDVVVENEGIDIVDDVEIPLPGDVARLEDRDAASVHHPFLVPMRLHALANVPSGRVAWSTTTLPAPRKLEWPRSTKPHTVAFGLMNVLRPICESWLTMAPGQSTQPGSRVANASTDAPAITRQPSATRAWRDTTARGCTSVGKWKPLATASSYTRQRAARSLYPTPRTRSKSAGAMPSPRSARVPTMPSPVLKSST